MKKLSQTEGNSLLVLLMKSLSDELHAYIQYKVHAARMRGIEGETIGPHLSSHGDDEYEHFQKLNKHFYTHGIPVDVDPEIHPGFETLEMLKLDLDDETMAIDNYTKIIRLCEDVPELTDTKMLIEDILVDEISHEAENAAFLKAKIPEREQGLMGAEKVAIAASFLMASEAMDNLGLEPLSEKYMKYASEI